MLDQGIAISELHSRGHAQRLLAPYNFTFHPSDFKVVPYSGVDSRNGWNTHIVHLAGYGVLGFTDGPC